jgi:hypothetical protein
MKMFSDYDHYSEHAIIVSGELIDLSEPEDYTATTAISGGTFINKYTLEWNNYILLF